MSGQGIGQILVYAAVLIPLSYPLGIYMSRVYMNARFGGGSLRTIERSFYGLVRTSEDREQDWKSYAKTVLVFSVLFSGLV